MKSNFKIILFYIVIIIVFISLAGGLLADMDGMAKELTYSDVKDLFYEEKVSAFEVTADDVLNMELKDGTLASYKLRSTDYFVLDMGEIIEQQRQDGIISKYDYKAPETPAWWVTFLPYLLILVFFVVMWFVVMNQAMGGSKGGMGGRIGSFGRARVKMGADEKKKVTFADVAGADEEKEELREVVDFLKNPAKFADLGARIPRGVLLVGPPGTGKTLLAKAVAGEANVPFFSISGSDFVEMYVGVGASRVRDLFDNAKKSSPCIIFIDEIDAVGRHRGAGLGGGHDEREQTLNQLLVEMDGFGSNDGVIVMAATNRPDILDPALLRPGRFDREVTVNYPDMKGREEILAVHAKGKPFEEDVDLKTLAKSTAGFTGADLANLLNEAALLTARKGKRLIGMKELEEATIKVIVGSPKKSKVISDKEKRLTAFHEAGHAVVSFYLDSRDPVHQISIIPSGRAGGYTLYLPTEDKSYTSKNDMQDDIVGLLGGRVAEKLVLEDISTGASNDLQRATDIARKMVTVYGMSDKLGPIVYGTGHEEVFLGKDFGSTKNYSEKVAAEIDEEIKAIVNAAYDKAVRILSEHMDKVEFVANFLIGHEVMDEDQFAAAMNGNPTVEELEAITDAKKDKSREENTKREKELEEKAKKEAAEKAQINMDDTLPLDIGKDEEKGGNDNNNPM